jgi:sugar lactone lactonase YvrE
LTVPAGTTSGKITITSNGATVSSLDNFTIVTPVYVPNVTVSTFKANCGYGIALDASGNIYLATGDCSSSYPASIVKISVGGTTTNLLENELAPYGIAVDANQNVYAVVGNQIKKITSNGTVSTLAGSTDAGDAEGQGTSAKFRLPYGVAVDPNGNVYVADMLNQKIRKITPDGTVTTLAGSSQGYADGTGANAQFNYPAGITVDRDGNVLVTEWANSKIRRITPAGVVTTIMGSATTGYNDGPIAQAQFNLPYGIAVDANGTIYVADENNFVIRRITSNGNVSTVAGSCYGYADGSGASAKFGNVRGIALDASGNIYVSDADHGKIRKIVIN